MVHFGLVFLMMRAGNLFLLNLEFSIFSARYFRSMSCSSDILPYETTFWTIGLWLDIRLKVKNKYKKCTIIRRIWAPKFEVVYFFRHMRKDEFLRFSRVIITSYWEPFYFDSWIQGYYFLFISQSNLFGLYFLDILLLSKTNLSDILWVI